MPTQSFILGLSPFSRRQWNLSSPLQPIMHRLHRAEHTKQEIPGLQHSDGQWVNIGDIGLRWENYELFQSVQREWLSDTDRMLDHR